MLSSWKKLNWHVGIVLVLAAASLSLVGMSSREPRNLSLCKEEVKAYVTSEKYMEDIREVTTQAQEYIEKRLDPSRRNAMVLDIDETALSHLRYELDFDFGFSRATYNEWLQKAEADPIPPTLELYKWTKSKGLAVFFISGNKEKLRAPLARNLSKAGYAEWDSLYLRPEDNNDPGRVFRTKTRKEITERGYYIVANIGDQESDLVGGYAEKTFKLPNPMYLVQ